MDIIADYQNVKILRLKLGNWDTNAYIIIDPLAGKSALIDVPDGGKAIVNRLKGTQLDWIILTHNHPDHTGGLAELRGRIISAVVVHPLDNQNSLPVKPDMDLHDHDCLLVGSLKLEVIHSPGHTQGSVCLRLGKYLFGGDTLFPGGPGRTATPQDFQKILKSISEKILTLPDDTRIYPGHGPSVALRKARQEYADFVSRQHPAGLCGDVTWNM